MKIYIVVEDKEKGFLKIPISFKDCHKLYKRALADDHNDIIHLHKTFGKVLDAKYSGECYTITDTKKMTFEKSKKKFYHGFAKPKWRKNICKCGK